METELNVVTVVKVPTQQVKDLLCCAIEGGSNYWVEFINRHGATKQQAEYRQDVPFVAGAYLEVKEDNECGPGRTFTIGLNEIHSGLVVMAEKYPKHFADVMSENMDATTGDVFLQCCCFGEVIYG